MKRLALLIAGALSLSQAHALINYQITGAQVELVGSAGAAVTGSGVAGNYDSNTTVGDFAVFDVEGRNDANAVVFGGQLRVTYSVNNNLSSASEVMIARTVNSQGLTDAATFTVLVDTGNGGGGVRLGVDWFEAGTYSGATENFDPETRRISQQINFTTFDIDFEQYVAVERSALTSYTLDNSTVLSAVDNGTTISFEDAGANSTVTDPTTAAEFVTISASSYYFEMGKQNQSGPALFMFEMRDPSSNVTITGTPIPVPEPAAFAGILALCVFVAVLGRRRN